MGEDSPRARRSIAAKLEHLFQEVHPRGRGSFSYKEVADGIRATAGEDAATPSHSIIQQIRTGANTNPKIKTLEAIAGFFGVPSAYFFDDAVTDKVNTRIEELKNARYEAAAQDELAEALEDADIRAVTCRLVGLSSTTLHSIRGIVEHARQVEGLPEVKTTPRQRR